MLAAAYKKLRGSEEPSASYAQIPKFYSVVCWALGHCWARVACTLHPALSCVSPPSGPLPSPQLPKEDQLLRQKLRAAARTSFLRKMNSELMTHEELQRLWEVLEELNSPPRAGDDLVGGAYGWWVGLAS